MVWARIDDCILDNPKIAKAGVYGFAMHVAGITWCCRNLSDGHIPYARVTALLTLENVLIDTANPMALADGDRSMGGDTGLDPHIVAGHLVTCGLWRRTETGYEIHDFLKYNPSREHVESKRAKANERQEKHRLSRSVSRRDSRADNGVTSRLPDPDPDPKEIEREMESRSVSRVMSRRDIETEPHTTLVRVVTDRTEPRPTLAPMARQIDPKLVIDDDSRRAAEQLGIREIDVEWTRFVNKCLAKGEASVDFQALFRSRLSFVRNDQRRERDRDMSNGHPRSGVVSAVKPAPMSEERIRELLESGGKA